MFIKIAANKNIRNRDREGNLSVPCFYGGKGGLTRWQMQM